MMRRRVLVVGGSQRRRLHRVGLLVQTMWLSSHGYTRTAVEAATGLRVVGMCEKQSWIVVDKPSGLRSVPAFGPSAEKMAEYEARKLVVSEATLREEYGGRKTRKERFAEAVAASAELPERVRNRAYHLPRTKRKFVKYLESKAGGRVESEAALKAWTAVKDAVSLMETREGLEESDSAVSRVQRVFDEACPVHRLDQSTSGVLCVALNSAIAANLSRQWRQRTVEKRYLALVDGHPPQPSGQIDLPLERIDTPRHKGDVPRMVVAPGGKPSLTLYSRRPSFTTSSSSSTDDSRRPSFPRDATSSLLDLTPHTGRLHQLRAHLAAVGHPILGDDIYAPPRVTARAPRLCLHASYLAFSDPHTGDRRHFSSPAPDFFQAPLPIIQPSADQHPDLVARSSDHGPPSSSSSFFLQQLL